MELKEIIKNIRKKTTLKIWAEQHGFEYQTVVKVFNGFTGKRRIGITAEILAQAEKDGYYTPEKVAA